MILLRVWGKTLIDSVRGWIGAKCIKKKTLLLGTYPARKHPKRQANCPSVIGNHEKEWQWARVYWSEKMERPVIRQEKQDEEWVWHACFCENKSLSII